MSCLRQLLVIFLIWTTNATFTEEPVSVTAQGGENALFHCNGSGIAIGWVVDGMYLINMDLSRGIKKSSAVSSGTVHSTLTVPATSVNNGTTVHCILFPGSMTSGNATLTVLSGIGQVVNLRFTKSFSTVRWDTPATAGVLGGLSYIVIVTNNNTGQVIVSATTNSTNYPLTTLQPCQFYTANVTAFSSEHRSDSVVTGRRVPGVLYNLAKVSVTMVKSYNTTHSVVTFEVDIRQGGPVACPNQHLVLVTFPKTNKSDRTQHTNVTIAQPDVIQYTVFVEKSCHCVSNIMITTPKNRVVKKRTVHFSSYNVQGCDVSTDHISILVDCTFAINSKAPGFVVVQDEQNASTRTLIRNGNKGSVNITDLSAGEYNISVYDNMEDYQNIITPAYEHSELQIVALSPAPLSSAVATDTSNAESISVDINSVSPTTNPTSGYDFATAIIASVVAVVAVVVVIGIFSIALCLALMAYKKDTSGTLDKGQRQQRYELQSCGDTTETQLSTAQNEENSQHSLEPVIPRNDPQLMTDHSSPEAVVPDAVGKTNNTPPKMDIRSSDNRVLASDELMSKTEMAPSLSSDETRLRKRTFSN